ncbi:DYNAMIN-RELATED PROTEIN [Salix koriyanagi]|uniref:DYNAMIN-RELATED PROTEIN n=1 Tax=Salix koriyanagi TaxID=2511006 RepID=A0A9Q1A4V7_9ROSI|nr:DYNAMIN-RELATED PROTEIN [Salix koriyanagi]
MGGGKPSSKGKGAEEYGVESQSSANAEVLVEYDAIFQDHVPIVSYYNDRITPVLDAVDRLRQLQVMKEGIQLPTIVVVGDQSSGKSSVLESLACINLPRGDGICTRVPLIMRLKHHPSLVPEIYLQYNDKTVHTDEAHIADAINLATDEIAGSGKGISDSELTLVVKKNGVPDLTLVDLPGITRVPVHGQPENIYEQIAGIIMKYISPDESVILNVLSASVDFSTCESIMMSQKVDKKGERTIAVVTKVDKSPEGLLEKVTRNDVNVGLGYVCVRNRIGNESYQDARKEEAALFATHQLLSKIDKSTVGIQVLAQKLVQIQAKIIAKCLPDIVRKIDEKFNDSVSELSTMPRRLLSVAEVIAAFMGIIASSKESLMKILLKLHKCSVHTKNFMVNEIEVLQETKGIELPNTLPHTAFLAILQQKVEEISKLPRDFVEKVWTYIEYVRTFRWRRGRDYTCNPGYMKKWHALLAQQPKFFDAIVAGYHQVTIEGFEDVQVGHLRELSIRNLVSREIENVNNELVGSPDGVIERMLEEPPSVASKREKLNTSIKLLRESQEVMANIIDKIEIGGH